MMKKLPVALETSFDFEYKDWILKLLKFLPAFIIKRYLYQVTYKYSRGELLELKIISLLTMQNVFLAEFSSKDFDLIQNTEQLEKSLENFAGNWLREMSPIINSLYKNKQNVVSAPGRRLLIISNFFYSAKNQREIFNPIFSDWYEDYFETLTSQSEWKVLKLRMVTIRNIWAFSKAMFHKSPIGDLIEFIGKFKK